MTTEAKFSEMARLLSEVRQDVLNDSKRIDQCAVDLEKKSACPPPPACPEAPACPPPLACPEAPVCPPPPTCPPPAVCPPRVPCPPPLPPRARYVSLRSEGDSQFQVGAVTAHGTTDPAAPPYRINPNILIMTSALSSNINDSNRYATALLTMATNPKYVLTSSIQVSSIPGGWLQIDLGEEKPVAAVVVRRLRATNRVLSNLRNPYVVLLDQNKNQVAAVTLHPDYRPPTVAVERLGGTNGNTFRWTP